MIDDQDFWWHMMSFDNSKFNLSEPGDEYMRQWTWPSSADGLSPVRHRAFTCIAEDLLPVEPWEINFG